MNTAATERRRGSEIRARAPRLPFWGAGLLPFFLGTAVVRPAPDARLAAPLGLFVVPASLTAAWRPA